MKFTSPLAAAIAAALWAIAGSGIDLASAAPIPTLFNTGVSTNNADGTPATVTPDQANDEHYAIVAGVAGALIPFVTKQGVNPFPSWSPDSTTSKWISPQATYPTGTTPDSSGTYTYRTTFDLTGFDTSTVAISGRLEDDNYLAAIRINGFDIGFSRTGGYGFSSFAAFTLPGGHYVSGGNTLEFDVTNAAGGGGPNPSGLRVELTGTGEHSSNAYLVSLVPSPGTLAPVFSPATSSYTANLPDTTASMTVTPTASDSAATIQVRVNGGSYSAVASGTASAPLPLDLGVNTIDVKVTAPDATATKIYTITVSIPKRVGTWAERTVVRTLAPNFSGEVDIGALTFDGGTGSIEAAVKATGTGWTISKRYVIPIRNDLGNGSPPNTWLKVLPTHDTGANGVNNFDLEINVSGATAQLRLRTVGTNAEVTTARVALKTIGLHTLVNSTATTPFVDAPTQTIAGNAVDEWKGQAGIGAAPSANAVLDVNGGNTRGLRLRPRSTAGAPTTGTWTAGTIILDSAANLFICTAAGTPGTWKKVGN